MGGSRLGILSTLVLLAEFVTTATTADNAKDNLKDVQDKLRYLPKQKDVDYETPPADQLAKCKVEVERAGKMVGFVVIGPAGQVLRRYYDTDGDNQVDQWRYYQHGIEVYRDIDTIKDDQQVPNQYRWLNLGGSRWGIDKNGDHKIDEWKSLSAAEASRVAIHAMTTGDAAALQSVMVTQEDLRTLGVNSGVAAKLLEGTANIATAMKAATSKSKVLTPQSKWIRFDAQMPGSIPSDEGKATTDLQVYENAMVVVEPGPGLVQIGEMIRVGDVWKLTQVPQPIDLSSEKVITAGGVLMQPLLAGTSETAIASSPEVEKLVKALQELDQKQPQFGVAKPAEVAAYHNRRADMLMKLHEIAEGKEEKEQFLKQCADGLASAVQTGTFPDGLQRLAQLDAQVRKTGPATAVPYVTYRRIQAQYSVDMNAAAEDKRDKIQKDFMASLEQFVDKYPQAEDTPDAMWTIATAEEFTNRMKEATEWYQRLAKHTGNSPTVAKAAGALRRLELKGKNFAITGKDLAGNPINTAQLRGRGPVLVVFWATWCDPYKTDLPQLRALYQQYHDRGFEIVGVCLDVPLGPPAAHNKQIQDFLTTNKVSWPQIMEPAGLDSPPAVQYGVFSLPTMFLIGSKGEVLSRNSSVTELKTVLPTLLK